MFALWNHQNRNSVEKIHTLLETNEKFLPADRLIMLIMQL